MAFVKYGEDTNNEKITNIRCPECDKFLHEIDGHFICRKCGSTFDRTDERLR